MILFPLFTDIEGQRFLVVGSGRVATGKIKRLLPFTNCITLVAPDADPEQWRGTGITVYARPYGEQDLEGAAFVVVATDRPELNKAIADSCHAQGIPVDVADDPGACTFVFPSLIRRGDLTIGITSGGKSPAYTKLLRTQIDDLIPDSIEAILDRMNQIRQTLKDRIPVQSTRSQVYREILSELIQSDNHMSETEIEEIIRRNITDQ